MTAITILAISIAALIVLGIGAVREDRRLKRRELYRRAEAIARRRLGRDN